MNSLINFKWIYLQVTSSFQWEDWLLTLLDDTIREIDLDEWTVALAGSMTQQFGLYGQGQVREKCFLMRCLGQVCWQCAVSKSVSS